MLSIDYLPDGDPIDVLESGLQQFDCRIEQGGIAQEQSATLGLECKWPPAPVRCEAARAFDYGGWRREIEGIESGIY